MRREFSVAGLPFPITPRFPRGCGKFCWIIASEVPIKTRWIAPRKRSRQVNESSAVSQSNASSRLPLIFPATHSFREPREKNGAPASWLAAGDGSQDDQGFCSRGDRIGQRGIWRFVRQVFLTGEESQKGPAL